MVLARWCRRQHGAWLQLQVGPSSLVRHAVFAVAGFGGAEAEREGADQVAELGLELEPGRGLVGGHVQVLGQVQNGLDGDLGVGLGAPLPDLLRGDRAAGLLQPGDPAGAEDGGLFEVHVQHHLTLAACAALRVAVGELESSLAARDDADREGTAYVEGLGRAEQPEFLGAGGDCSLEVQGVGQVQVAVHPDPPGDARPRPARCRSARPRRPRGVRPRSAPGRTGPWPPRSTGPAAPARSCARTARPWRPRTPPPPGTDRSSGRRSSRASTPAAHRPDPGPAAREPVELPRPHARGNGARTRWTDPGRRRTR